MNRVSSSRSSARDAKPSVNYSGEPADVRELLAADDRGETVSMSRAEIRALFKPGKDKRHE